MSTAGFPSTSRTILIYFIEALKQTLCLPRSPYNRSRWSPQTDGARGGPNLLSDRRRNAVAERNVCWFWGRANTARRKPTTSDQIASRSAADPRFRALLQLAVCTPPSVALYGQMPYASGVTV